MTFLAPGPRLTGSWGIPQGQAGTKRTRPSETHQLLENPFPFHLTSRITMKMSASSAEIFRGGRPLSEAVERTGRFAFSSMQRVFDLTGQWWLPRQQGWEQRKLLPIWVLTPALARNLGLILIEVICRMYQHR
jgi:hypothetical protein